MFLVLTGSLAQICSYQEQHRVICSHLAQTISPQCFIFKHCCTSFLARIIIALSGLLQKEVLQWTQGHRVSTTIWHWKKVVVLIWFFASKLKSSTLSDSTGNHILTWKKQYFVWFCVKSDSNLKSDTLSDSAKATSFFNKTIGY